MAASITVAPTAGHALLWTQAGIGATPGYDAIDLRRMAQASSAGQEGVFEATGWEVTQDSGGAAMSVTVKANVGLAVVGGDSISHQGFYVVAPHSAEGDLDVASNASGNPRIDQVILQVYDGTHDGSGLYEARFMILQGTATSGATLANRTGATALPANALRLADILVANGASTLPNSVIRDRRPWARGALKRIVRLANASAGSDYTTTSTSLTNLDGTNVYPRIECTGNPVRMTVQATVSHSNGGEAPWVAPWLDGAAVTEFGTSGVQGSNAYGANQQSLGAWTLVWTPAAGSHQIGIGWRTTSGTLTFRASAAAGLMFTVEELVRQNVGNNETTSG